jgi:hypothetical protein
LFSHQSTLEVTCPQKPSSTILFNEELIQKKSGNSSLIEKLKEKEKKSS